MTRTVRLGRAEIGAGAPAIVVPLVARDVADLAEQAAAARGAADVLEWRMDYTDDLSPEAVLAAGRALVQAADGTPVLATYRTAAEGGARRLGTAGPDAPQGRDHDYVARYRALLAARLVDAVDIETALGDAVVAQVVAAAHEAGAVVVGSSHDTAGTPPTDQIVARLVGMADAGTDVCKVAVTPHSPDDVLTLLAASHAASRRLDQPLVTVAMGPLGVVTRLAGETFGSAATFGTVGPSSAPGQVDAVALRQVVDLVHRALTGPGRRQAPTLDRLWGVSPSSAAPHPAWGPVVVLCGPMGSGKSSVGRALSRRWQLTFRDTDEDVEAATGRTVAEVFADDGEDRFRQVERDMVAQALGTHDGILALGGGAVLHPATRTALGRYAAGGGIVVFLDVSEPVAARRVSRNAARPLLLDDPGRWKQVADARRPVYEQVATLQVATDDITPEEVAAEIERQLQVARTASLGDTSGGTS